MRLCTKCGREIGIPTTPEAWFYDFFTEGVLDAVKDEISYALGQIIAKKLETWQAVFLCGACSGSVTSNNREQLNSEMEDDRLAYIDRLRRTQEGEIK